MKFRRVLMPKEDCDIVLVFPGNEELVIQARPSNADNGYNGSLDIILPTEDVVTNWQGEDMEPAPQWHQGGAHERLAKQLSTELPGIY